MKLRVKLRCAALALPLLLVTAVQAATVIWPAVSFGQMDAANYFIASDISPGGDAWITFEVVQGPDYMFAMQGNNMTLGIRHWWFAPQYGTAIDASAMEDADYLVNADPVEFGSIYMPLNQVFYLGFQLDGPPAPDYPHPPLYYVYGWASLLWDGTELTLVDSAAETTGVGIYAGTYDAIPEPTSAGLLLAGIAAALLRRRRPHSRLRSGDGG